MSARADRVAASRGIEPTREGVTALGRSARLLGEVPVRVGREGEEVAAVFGEGSVAGIESNGVGGRRHGILDAVLNGGLRQTAVTLCNGYVIPLARATSIVHCTERLHTRINVIECIGSHRAQLAGIHTNRHGA